MTTLHQLEARLHAWQGFHGIAGATRTLAASQSRMWSEAARRAEQHLRSCVSLLAAYPGASPRRDAPRVVVALGTDLGLCGPFNRAVARQLAECRRSPPAVVLVVGARLRSLVDDDVLTLPAPTSFARVEGLAAQIEALLRPHVDHRLVLVRASGIEPDGGPQVSAEDEPEPELEPELAQVRCGEVVELVEPQSTAATVASLTRHARLVAALVRSAASESEARWRTMNRAHDAAERRIAEQRRTLARRRQEQVTQQMLEARQGSRRPRSPP